jgi:alanyl-tRNA synthetase
MKFKEIRRKYLEFFKARKHAVIPSASLIPDNDSSTLFIGSGMQPLVPYLLGEKHPAGKRLVDSQKCFRAEDIAEVGDSRHTTFFEMLGNWSLGDYFKKEQLRWFFEFSTDELGLDPSRLYITVFRGNSEIGIAKDDESVAIWKELFKEKGIEAKDIDFSENNGMSGGRIFYYDEKKNWWSRSGVPLRMPVGEPGGPDSEVFYDLGADAERHENSPFKDLPCHINCDCGRFIEIGNSVFMEYVKTESGFEKLKQRNVDFGGGLERLAMVCQGKSNIFETDLFSSAITGLEKLSEGKKYQDNVKPFEIIIDHLRGAVFIMADHKGVCPSNTEQGYIVRRLIRRAIRYGNALGIKKEMWTNEIAKIIVEDYKEDYPELEKNKNFVENQLQEEEEKFQRALGNGLKEFNKIKISGNISGKSAFDLYQTYGFPFEITEELAKENNIEVDKDGFEEELKKHQDLSRSTIAGKFKSGLADASRETIKFHTATHILLAALRNVLGDCVFQKGSNITAERLRLDFSWPEKLTPEQLEKVQEIANKIIEDDLPVSCGEMTLDQAKKQGAMGVFESKYGDKVRVYAIGKEKIFSREICAGPHIKRTGELGKIKIIKEESSSSGVRRIKAVFIK